MNLTDFSLKALLWATATGKMVWYVPRWGDRPKPRQAVRLNKTPLRLPYSDSAYVYIYQEGHGDLDHVRASDIFDTLEEAKEECKRRKEKQ